MTVNEMIKCLSAFDGDMEVSITDGFAQAVYEGEFSFLVFTEDEKQMLDIGIGGLRVNE